MIPLPLLLVSLLFGTAVSQNLCDSPADLGKSCVGSNSSIRFYFDKDMRRCLPFKYSGCGGNENNFSERHECVQRCTPMDHLFCPANTPPMKNVYGSTDCGQNSGDVKCANPDKSFCHMGPNGAGMCCSLEAQKKVNQDREPTCPNGKKKYSVFRGQKDRIVIGKSCEHQFCPEEYDCQKGNFYAYCCAK
ncbi:hypothetical protein B9Z55_018680 [Caenorhabditis nigoni]|uniref:BPTI/Kunitz inhibitor domain-containing protein n=1 Tax=Caenorhabditis nigoni TaxID=1611254 RepID=A0A2G5TFA4_9PELO|nr:hypothetical protein B9Z55_018680 [Caenorhabditis nigoni]